MKVKFNKYERVAGLFVLTAIAGVCCLTVVAGLRKGWFATRVEVYAVFPEAEGVLPGTPVQMSGLRAGEVEDVSLTDDNRVKVRFSLKDDFFARVRADSRVQIVRPFIIGERTLDVSMGSATSSKLEPGGQLTITESLDVLDLLGGKTLGAQLATMVKAAESFRKLVEAMTDPMRTDTLIKTIDSVHPMVVNVSEMSKEVSKMTAKLNHSNQLEQLVRNTAVLTGELNKILPQLNEAAPNFGQDMGQMSKQVAALTNELAKLTPLLTQMGPEMPRVSKRAVEALDEAVVTLKAIQKTFLVRGAAKEVREEEKLREPAQDH